VPDLRVPPGDAPVAHLATPQWQSFEIRMRARKADRCLQRATAALDSGSINEASDAIDEARQLSPLHPRLGELSARLNAVKSPPPAAVHSHGHAWATAAIVAGLVVAGAAGWEVWVHRDNIAQLVPTAHPDMDASAGLATPTPVNIPASQASAQKTAAGTSDSTDELPRTVVQTTLVRPEVIDMRVTPSESRTSNEPTSVATAGSDLRSDTKADTAKALLTTDSAEPPARPQRDTAPSLPLSAEYRTPAALPASLTPQPATNVIPSVVPAIEPPRPTNTSTTASATNPAMDATAPPPAAAAPPPASAPTASASAAESVPMRDDRVAIRAALSRYESAYNRLDVDAVRSIWPSLDQRALARAFDSLNSQRVALQNCNVDVSGTTARANCSGNAAWTPKVGGGQQSSARMWTFDLSESNGAWRITHVRAR
jgi:hypothetical protein